MNISLSALKISNYYGPAYFTNSLKSTKSKVSFDNIRGNQLFNSFYQSYVPNTHFKLTRSQFSNCLDQVVHIDSNKYELQTLYSRISLIESDPLTISNNLFYKIYTLSKEGGALEVNSEDSFRFNNNGFFFCSSDSNSGAISIKCSSFNGNGNCFDSCKAGENEMAGKINVKTRLSSLNLNATSIYHCSPGILSGQGNSFRLTNGEEVINHYNATSNFVAGGASGIWISAGGLLSAKYLNIDGCDSINTVCLSGMSATDANILYMNMVNNNFRKGSAILMTSFKGNLFNVVFRNNTCFNNTIYIDSTVLSNALFTHVRSDMIIDKYPNPDQCLSGHHNITGLKILSFPATEQLVYLSTKQCWALDAEDVPGGIKGFVIRWERTLLLAGSTAGLVIIALVGKRLWQNRRSKRSGQGPQDTERLKNETSYNYEYDFDVL